MNHSQNLSIKLDIDESSYRLRVLDENELTLITTTAPTIGKAITECRAFISAELLQEIDKHLDALEREDRQKLSRHLKESGAVCHILSIELTENYDALPPGLQVWERLKLSMPDAAWEIFLAITDEGTDEEYDVEKIDWKCESF